MWRLRRRACSRPTAFHRLSACSRRRPWPRCSRSIIGIPLLTLRGHHLAFATLAMQLICLSLVGQDARHRRRHRTCRESRGSRSASFELETDRDYAYLAWGALALVVLTTRNVIASRPGRALRALATSEVAAESSGVPVGRYKLTVFALAGAFGGLAGGIYAFFIGYVAPGSLPGLALVRIRRHGRGRRARHHLGRRSLARRRSRSWSSCSIRWRPSRECPATRRACCRTRPIPRCSSPPSLFLPDGLVAQPRVRAVLSRLR